MIAILIIDSFYDRMTLTWTLVCAVDLSSSTWSLVRWSLKDSKFLNPASSQPVHRHIPWLNKGWEGSASSVEVRFVLFSLFIFFLQSSFTSFISLFSVSSFSISLSLLILLWTKDLVCWKTEGNCWMSGFTSSFFCF